MKNAHVETQVLRWLEKEKDEKGKKIMLEI